MRKKLLILSLICLIVSLFIFAFDYFFYHYVTDYGISIIKQDIAQKPFVTNLIGILGVMFLFSSILSLISSFVFFEKTIKE